MDLEQLARDCFNSYKICVTLMLTIMRRLAELDFVVMPAMRKPECPN
jgi:hypothetical protein